MFRRNFLQLLSIALSVVGASVFPGALDPRTAGAETITLAEGERALGLADAPITLVEYASLTCSHCASFHTTTFKDIKKDWIDSGKVRFVFRHMPSDGLAGRAAVALESIDDDGRFFAALGLLMKTQEDWSGSDAPLEKIKKTLLLAGVSRNAFEAALENQTLIGKVIQQARLGQEKYGIKATPSFVVNGKVYNNMDYSAFSRVLEKEL